jgi:hypothetical protein
MRRNPPVFSEPTDQGKRYESASRFDESNGKSGTTFRFQITNEEITHGPSSDKLQIHFLCHVFSTTLNFCLAFCLDSFDCIPRRYRRGKYYM